MDCVTEEGKLCAYRVVNLRASLLQITEDEVCHDPAGIDGDDHGDLLPFMIRRAGD